MEILRHNSRIASMSVADVNGDLFTVRSVDNSPAAATAFKAPSGTSFIVQGMDRKFDELVAEHVLFLDDKLFVIDEKTLRQTTYDHRRQPWFKASVYTHGIVTTDYYLLSETNQAGLTIARRLKEGHGVVAADLTLRDISDRLADQRITPSSELLLLYGDGSIISHSDFGKIAPHLYGAADQRPRMPKLSDFDTPVFIELAKIIAGKPSAGPLSLRAGPKAMLGYLSFIQFQKGRQLYLVSLIPRDELLSDIIRLKNQSILISLGLLAGTILIVLYLSKRISGSLRHLAREAQKIREFKFDGPIDVQTRILEVNDLSETMAMMKASIEQFLKISRALSEEKDMDALLEMILLEAREVSASAAGAIGLISEDERSLEIVIVRNDETGRQFGGASIEKAPMEAVDLSAPIGKGEKPSMIRHAITTGKAIQVDDLQTASRFDHGNIRRCFEKGGFRCQALLIVPLTNQKKEIVGCLILVNPKKNQAGRRQTFSSDIVSYIKALSSDAAVALDNRRLLKSQRDLTDSIVHLIAGSIDAKSPYTSRHCQRVPIIVRMLADAAQTSTEPPFADFALNADETYALHLASWLHDCGKLTTPEYVIDKATKLETITNRIHEIRMRFEVLWRDAQIDYYKTLASESGGTEDLDHQLNRRLKALQNDFAFVARCNIGGESISTGAHGRLQKIGQKTWTRHFDDRLGISQAERARKPYKPQPLPVREPLLADKEEHIVHRQGNGIPLDKMIDGFAMDVPPFEANLGEIVNLSIAHGTLTPEERFAINNHIIQTIRMLRSLPWPRELQQVPDWAGNHHETYCGEGYPRRLMGRDLSIPERIMAVADVFEALTAADRPYKQPRSLSETIFTMKAMCDQGHLCPDIFGLLLTSGVYRQYADRYLDPQQIDTINVDAVLAEPELDVCPKKY